MMNDTHCRDKHQPNGLTNGRLESTMKYWQEYIQGVEHCRFPALSDSPSTEVEAIDMQFDDGSELLKFCEREDVSLTNVIQLTWAIILKCYTGDEQICFGYMTKENNLLPIRLDLGGQPIVRHLLQDNQQTLAQSVKNQDCPLGQVYQSLALPGTLPFNTLVTSYVASGKDILLKLEEQQQTNFDLILNVTLDDREMHMSLIYQTSTLPGSMGHSLIGSLSAILLDIARHSEKPVSTLIVASTSDYHQMVRWNRPFTGPSDTCIHDLIHEVCHRQPKRPAVYSWDGQLTYQELWECSTQLCQYLQSRGIGSEMPVPICMDKSPLTVVSILAVLRAGATCVPIDPNMAIERLRGIVEENSPLLILISPSAAHLDFKVRAERVVVSPVTWPQLSATQSSPLPSVNPSDAAFIHYTSGSTGRPKGIIVQHNGVCTGVLEFGRVTNITQDSRVLQFASYLWEMSMVETLMTLVRGGCVCLPSEQTRTNDLKKFILDAQVTMCSFTPSVIRLFKPTDFPGVQTISLIGEPLTMDIVDSWASQVRLINGYGPTEGGPITSGLLVKPREWQTGDVGKATPGAAWIVNPSASNQPLPVGAVGEILIQGPTVARGYLKRPEATEMAFIPRPSWLPTAESEEQQHRFYLTGDLGRYNLDGSIRFIGRKDRQVKVNGQRIELEEVEVHVRRILPATQDVVVEAVQPTHEPTSKMLVAFVAPNENRMEDAALIASDDIFLSNVQTLRCRLQDTIPQYMMPQFFLQISHICKNRSGKVDRRRITELVHGLSRQDLEALVGSSKDKAQPTTENENLVQTVWAQCLNVSPNEIGRNQNFFSMGGESLAAMKVVSRMRSIGFNIAFADLFDHPTLAALAQVLQKENETVRKYQPFSLISGEEKVEGVHHIARDYGVSRVDIEDIYPCTALQTGLISLTMRQSGLYVASYAYRLSEGCEVERLVEAWRVVVDNNPILRTRIIQSRSGRMLQVVLNNGPDVIIATPGGEKGFPETSHRSYGLGTPLMDCTISTQDGGQFLILTGHHSVYDGWSLSQLVEQLESAYAGQPFESPPFSRFLQYLNELDSSASDNFWRSEFANLSCSTFPPEIPRKQITSVPSFQTVECSTELPSVRSEFTMSTVIRFAWALVMADYTGSPDVVFGSIVAGRSAPVVGIERMTGPTIATVPLRVTIDPEASVRQSILQLQTRSIAMIPHEQTGLQNIRAISPETHMACQFRNILVVEQEQHGAYRPNLLHKAAEKTDTTSEVSEYPLSVACHVRDGEILVQGVFDTQVLDQERVNALLQHLGHVVQEILQNSTKKLSELDLIGPHAIEQLQVWNRHMPEPVDKTVHELIAENFKTQPDAPAICAWDGSLTYGELDVLSGRLADVLVQRGVKPETLIPIYLPRSKWTPVAMLAVMRSGGAIVLMDTTMPVERLKVISSQIEPPMILTQSSLDSVASSIAPSTIHVDSIERQVPTQEASLWKSCRVQPNNIAYVIFTSGSTGTPKGVMIEHRSFAANVPFMTRTPQINASTRVFQFSSYSFDATYLEHLGTLFAGGCLCIPSLSNRDNDMAQAARELEVNLMVITPSVAALFGPQDIPTLRILVLAGEAMTAELLTKWASSVTLINGYGPSECCVQFCSSDKMTNQSNPGNIGSSHAGFAWVVRPDDCEKLAPIHTVGELLIESPTIARGYLQDEGKTAASFIWNPRWIERFPSSSRVRRFYKTGDLVKNEPDGSLVYVGRKDTQVKLRGQRMELGEIEYHLRSSFSEAQRVVADVITPQDETRPPTLMAFIEMPDARDSVKLSSTSFFAAPSSEFRSRAQGIQAQLRDKLTASMIPSIFLPVHSIPLLPSGKINRTKLQNDALLLTREEIIFYTTAKRNRRAPSTAAEQLISSLCSQVLKVPAEDIGMDDSFFELGGDSISAIRLVGAAREVHHQLQVTDIFTEPVLSKLCHRLFKESSFQGTVTPFSILEQSEAASLRSLAVSQCSVSPDQIEDIYPATALQGGLMALSVKHKGAYITQLPLRLPDDVDITRLQNAWQVTIAANDILRTRLVQAETGNLYQVVLNTAVDWLEATSLDEYLAGEGQLNALPGQPLGHSAIVRDAQHESIYLVLTLHHALYDGWSIPLLFQDLEAAYDERPLSPRRFAPFIEYISQSKTKAITDFWTEEFQGLSCSQFPTLPSDHYTPSPTEEVQHTISLAQSPSQYTLSTVLHLAWATVISTYTDSDDVVFGTTVAGRNVSVSKIEEMTGPTIATIPLRFQIDPEQKTQEALETAQRNAARMAPFQHIGLQNIRTFSPDTALACQFQSYLVVQPPNSEKPKRSDLILDVVDKDPNAAFDSYAVNIVCEPTDEAVTFRACFDCQVIDSTIMQMVLFQFGHVTKRILQSCEYISGLKDVSSQGMKQLQKWNLNVPEPIWACVQDHILPYSQRTPDAVAIDAWDGQLTFRELDVLSFRLATHLIASGVRVEQFVPILLDKSMLVPVAMLGVMRAGGALVLMDTSQPMARLQYSSRQLGATLIVTSEACARMAKDLGSSAIVLSPQAINSWETSIPKLPISKPNQALYCIFTSGSTGEPKGVIISHSSFSTTMLALGEKGRMTSATRYFQFASYAFDVSVSDHLTPLMHGGCICIPSKEQVKNALGRTIKQFQPTTFDLTPSLARIIDLDDASSAKLIMLGGEGMVKGDIEKWHGHAQLLNGYGPAECSINCVTRATVTRDTNPNDIGYGTGAVCWVTDPTDHRRLLPIGAIGELVIEGPAVGEGYLKDPERTAAQFVTNLPWLETFRGQDKVRAYKTGDLVQQQADGSLRYIGRKDMQVKVRGQRIELGEVEHHVQRSIEMDGQDSIVAAEAVGLSHNSQQSILVAFIAIVNDHPLTYTEPFALLPSAKGFRDLAHRVEQRMRDMVPAYMIPSVLLPVNHIPLSRTGKVDRKLLQTSVKQLSRSELVSYIATLDQKRAPETDIQRKVQAICAKVLNINPEDIGLDDNFLALGGDSISAMSFVARCRAQKIVLTVQQVFERASIEQLASLALSCGVGLAQNRETLDTPFGLSPIQQLFLETTHEALNHYNQSFFLRLRRDVSVEQVRSAIQSVVQRHSMLRARFSLRNDQWTQRITANTEGSYRFTAQQSPTFGDVEKCALDSQQCLNITAGPLMAVDLFDVSDHGLYIFLVAHHLVIDLVSWRIILSDLEEFINGDYVSTAPDPLSFQTWYNLEAEYARHSLPPQKVLPDISTIRNTDVDYTKYWGLTSHSIITADMRTMDFVLDKTSSEILLGGANHAFQTYPVELFQAALVFSFMEAFPDREPPVIYSEGHGREAWDSTVDLSQTVGWFTTVWPTPATATRGHSLVEVVQRTKDARRQMHNNGWEYFTSQYLHPEGPSVIPFASPVEVVFNYHGSYQQLEDHAALFEHVPDRNYDHFDMAPNAHQPQLFDISMKVQDGGLVVGFSYNRHISLDRVTQWSSAFKASLQEISQVLPSLPPRPTPSDVPLLSVGYQGLQQLIDNVNATRGPGTDCQIETAYPCLAIQQGILLSQARDSNSYITRATWDARPRDPSEPMDVSRFLRAWDRVVQRNPTLRTIFVGDAAAGSWLQIVLRKATGKVSVFDTPEASRQAPRTPINNACPWDFTVTITSPSAATCELVLNHALVDATSTEIIIQQLVGLYDDQPMGITSVAMREYIAYVQSLRNEVGIDFWKDYLAGIEPCLLQTNEEALGPIKRVPHTIDRVLNRRRQYQAFCDQHGVTLFNLAQVAWGLVLRHYTGSDSVCFGYLTSSRSVPVPDMESAVGPFINMFLSRMELTAESSIVGKLESNRSDFLRCLEHQHTSLADIYHSLGLSGGTLFNTGISFLPEPEIPPSTSRLLMTPIDGEDPTEYDVTINISTSGDQLTYSLHYNSDSVNARQAEDLVNTFEKALDGLVTPESTTISDISLLSNEHLGLLYQWNYNIPPAEFYFIDQVIERNFRSSPSAPAICAWDGELSYAELDELSSRLAKVLMDNGVIPNQIVPVHFEKSKWTSVAIVAILRAGGAFALLDASHPLVHLRAICQDVDARLVVSSTTQAATSRLLGNTITVGEEESLTWPAKTMLSKAGESNPSNLAYVIFTSGTTGKPKGVMVEHASYCTSAKAMSTALSLDNNSRVFQFASYAFDASIAETLACLMAGACLCVPSDSQRSDSLNETIKQYQVTWMTITPSLSRLIDPSLVPSVNVVTLVGEAVTAADVATWSGYASVCNGYGPAECAVSASFNPSVTNTAPSNIGFRGGSVGWVVDPNNHDSLMSVGAVGELLIEGPILARGYLNDPIKTAASFIEDPRWLQQFRTGGKRRLYKTGDLVKYEADGSMLYIGRKDKQIKLRGQRIELGHVEHHVLHCFDDAEDVAVSLVTLAEGNGQPFLAAFIKQTGDDTTSSHNELFYPPSRGFATQVMTAQERLRETLPAYMHPSAFLPVSHIPLSRSDKRDLRRLSHHVSQLSRKEFKSYATAGTKTKRSPETEIERRVQRLWADILNIHAQDIGTGDSFFRLGGDSITAMRFVAQCRAQQLLVTVQDVMRFKTIAELAPRIRTGVIAQQFSSEVQSRPFSLSPVQQFFFDRLPDGQNHLNQSFFVKITCPLQPGRLAHAVEAIVKKHSMLRTRFRKDEQGWRQMISPMVAQSYRYRSCQLSHEKDLAPCTDNSQRSINITDGPLLAVDHITIGDSQYLFLVAHHMVVDLVSWRIILGDLETFLAGGSISSDNYLSFQTWCQLQADYVKSHVPPSITLPSLPDLHRLDEAVDDFWGICGKSNTLEDTCSIGFDLDATMTETLLGPANVSLRTQPVELFHVALLYSFVQTFPERVPPVIWNEGHGREAWDASLDPSQTVGWFTTLWPSAIMVDAQQSLIDVVRLVKDVRRQTRNKGWAYFTSRYLHPDGPQMLQTKQPTEVTMNYEGRYQQLERTDAILQGASSQYLANDAPSSLDRGEAFAVEISVSTGSMQVELTYNKYALHQDRIQQWITNCNHALVKLADQLPRAGRLYTLNDFPLMQMNYPELENFTTKILPKANISLSEVESAYPCSPIQSGMMLGQAKNPLYYAVSQTWEVSSTNPANPVNPLRLRDAWLQVVTRHSVLRTIFVDSPCSGRLPDQVVLKSSSGTITVVSSQNPGCTPKVHEGDRMRCPWTMKIIPSAAGTVLCEFNITHTLMDGESSRLLMRDFLLAYDSRPSQSPALDYSDYMAYLQSVDHKSTSTYWKTHLRGIEPCLFPAIAQQSQEKNVRTIEKTLGLGAREVRRFCERHDLTLLTLFQVVWALVLRCYVGSEDICFGYLTSGRDIPLSGIEAAVGPFINMLVCRLQIESSASITSLLRMNQENSMDNMTHQHCSLVDIQHELNVSGSSLFNTIFSLQIESSASSEVDEKQSLSIQHIKSDDPTEYDVAINFYVGLEDVDIAISYYNSTLSPYQANVVCDTVIQAVENIIENPDQTVDQTDFLSEECTSLIKQWNSGPLHAETGCLHELILDKCKKNPSAEAVCAWDGSLTYGELNDLSAALSVKLCHLGIGPERFVPLLMEKSMWVAVGILAVLRTGGAFTLLDESHPTERLRDISDQMQAEVILASPTTLVKASELAPQVEVLSGSQVESWTAEPPILIPGPAAQQYNAAFAIFTSGSTGKPKGVVMGHSASAASFLNFGPKSRRDEQSRHLQFSSHAFDICVADYLITFLTGGCICVPSEAQRANIPEAVTQGRVNHMTTTPTVAQLLHPSQVPTVRVMELIGEAMVLENIHTWTESVNLISSYGPAECTVATMRERVVDDPLNIGTPNNCLCWVVAPDNHHKLAPIGAVGELLIQGPTLSRGYLRNERATREAFIEPPTWLHRMRPDAFQLGPMFKTGDLVQYLPGGSLKYFGQKSSQVKLHGQRTELAEVEHYVHPHFPHAHNVVADVLMSPSTKQPVLVAFIAHSPPVDGEASTISFLDRSQEFLQEAQNTKSNLMEIVPRFMVPDFFIPIDSIPLSKAGKTHRRLLREAASQFSWNEMYSQLADSTTKSLPTTEMERKLLEVCSHTLGVDPADIGMEDDFFQLGGDSLSAMKLVSSLRAENLSLTVATVFHSPVLKNLVKSIETNAATHGTTNFENQSSVRLDKNSILRDLLWPQRVFQPQDISAILPANAHTAVYATQPFKYVCMEIVAPLDEDHLWSICQALIEKHSILRTLFVEHKDEILQIILYQWQALFADSHTDTQDIMASAHEWSRHDSLNQQLFGLPPTAFALIRKNPEHFAVVVRLSHAQYDGLSMGKLLGDLLDLYQSKPISVKDDFAAYIQHVHDQQTPSAFDFWSVLLEKSTMAPVMMPMKSSPTPSEQQALICCRQELPLIRPSGGITMATVIKAAWARVQSTFLHLDDLVFGQFVSGRNTVDSDLERVVGNCTNTIPVRVEICHGRRIRDLLLRIQAQHRQTMAFDTTPFKEIVSKSTAWSDGTEFGSVVHHKSQELADVNVSPGYNCVSRTAMWSPEDRPPNHLFLQTTETESSLLFELVTSGSLATEPHLEMLLSQTCRLVVAYLGNPDMTVGEIESTFS